jgi:hypothetical protein
MRAPAFQFYPGDWLRDPVAGCTLAAQGLWLRMMFLMHDSERYGYLVVNGLPMSAESIARRCGCTPTEYAALFTELSDAGIPSLTKDNVIFSRRMVRDAEDRQKNADRQKRFKDKTKTGESNAQGNAEGNGKVTHKSRASNTPSSSSSSNKNPALCAVPDLESDHQKLMAELHNRSGPISDGGAQGKAIKWLLSHYDAETCIRCLGSLKSEDWRKTRVSWLTVEKEIGDWLLRQEPKAKKRGLVL